jgi:hypothetical protein
MKSEQMEVVRGSGKVFRDFGHEQDLRRFTLDRLVSIINRLGSRIEIKVKVRRVQAAEHATA